MVAVPEWAQELFRAKGIEQVTRAEVVKDTAFHKLVIGYTPTAAVLAEKSLLGTAAYLLPALTEASRAVALPPAVEVEAPDAPKVRAKPKKPAKASAKKAPRGEVRPRPRKTKRTAPPPAPEAEPLAPGPAPEPEAAPAPAATPVDLDETKTLEALPDEAEGAVPGLATEMDAEPPAAPAAALTAGASAGHREGDFTLYARQQNGRPFYFFARGTPKSGEAVAMPEGYEVAWNERTRAPFLRRKR